MYYSDSSECDYLDYSDDEDVIKQRHAQYREETRTGLLGSACTGEVDEVERFIENGVDLNARDYEDHTPLMLAAKEGHSKIVKMLIEAGADIHLYSVREKSALQIAAKHGKVECLKLLTEAGAVMKTNDEYYEEELDFALMSAVNYGRIEASKTLIEAGAFDLKKEKSYASSSYNESVEKGYIDLVRLMIERGADPGRALIVAARKGNRDMFKMCLHMNEDDWKGTMEFALMNAASHGHPDIVQLCIDEGADINYRNYRKETSLFQASENGHREVVKILIANGAKLNLQDKNHTAPVNRAACSSNWNIVTLLAQAGANLNIVDLWRNTPLLWAIRYCENTEVIKTLIDAGARLNIRDEDTNTALMNAMVKFRDPEVILLLIKAGANVNLLYEEREEEYETVLGHKTMLMMLSTSLVMNKYEVAKALIEAGADIEAETDNRDGQTALGAAISEYKEDVVRALVESGANVDVNFSSSATGYKHILYHVWYRRLWRTGELLLRIHDYPVRHIKQFLHAIHYGEEEYNASFRF